MITYGSTTLTSYNSIVKTEVYYYKSTSATSLSGGSWATTKPTWENGKYIWQKIRTVYEDGTHTESDPVNITGQQGATGTAAYSYKLNSSDSIIGKTKDGEYTIKKITFSATYKQGTGTVSAYGGRFKIESTTNGSTWKTEYTSSGNEASKEFTIPDDIIAIKCSLYQSDGTTVLLDIVTVPVIKDGVDAIGLRDSIPYYLASDKDTGITRLTQGWTRYRPQLTAEKKYLWVYYVSRYSEGITEPELIEIKDDLVHFVNNGDESPVESCVVDIEPVQDLNGYDHPWPAGGGKNILNPSDPDYGNYTIGPDGTVTTHPKRITTGFIPCNEGVSLTFSTNKKTDTTGTNIQFGFAGIAAYDEDKNFISREFVNSQRSVTMVTPTGTKYVRAFEELTANGSPSTLTPVVFSTYEQQLELGSTATDYEPYSNICPITGWTKMKITRMGKNYLRLPTIEEINDADTVVSYKSIPIQLEPNTTYYLSTTFLNGYTAKGKGMYCLITPTADNNNPWKAFAHSGQDSGKSDGTLTTGDSGMMYIRFYGATEQRINDLYANAQIQLEKGSTNSTYEPYQGDTYDITFPSEAGTVYGGQLNVTTGELTVDKAMVRISDLSWYYSNDYGYFGTQRDVANIKNPTSATTLLSGLICSAYKSGAAAETGSQKVNGTIGVFQSRIRIRDENYGSDVNTWASTMGNETIVYPLATPITYTLTPQEITMLCKENNIFADTGQTAISYYDNQTSTDPYVDYSLTSAFDASTDALDKAKEVAQDLADLGADLQAQIDGKIETWCQKTDPSTAWTTTELKNQHNGDLWYYTGESTSTYKNNTTYKYTASTNKWTAYSASTDLFDKIDAKASIYYGKPSAVTQNLEVGDYLVDSTDGCSYRWDGSKWVKLTDYKAAIDKIEVGGRNLLLNSATEKAGASNVAQWMQWAISDSPLIANEEYMFSFDAKMSNSTDVFYIGFALNSSMQEIMKQEVLVTDTYKRYMYKVKTTKTNINSIIISNAKSYGHGNANNSTGILNIKNVKLEKGNKATKWTPAPEDIEIELTTVKNNLQSQIDEKIQTYYQSSNPASAWTTTALRTAHDGDLWYYTGTTTATYTKDNVYRYNGSNNTWTTYSASGELFDKVDGKSTIYYGTTSDTYTGVETGDYLIDANDGSSYRYDGSKWIKVTDYKSAIDNIEIGGRNLARNTQGAIIDKIGSAEGSRAEYAAFDLGCALPLNDNDDISISFDLYMIVRTANPYLNVYNSNNKGVHQTCIMTKVVSGNSYQVGDVIDKHIAFVSTIHDRESPTLPHDYLEFYSEYGSNNFFRISNLKVEKGNKPTAWTPAPEDVDASISTAQTTADTAMDRATAIYGTCSTPTGTVAKAVTCPNFVLFDGARIQVTFTNTNTASAPTLNVNSTGAKPIYINKTVTSSSNLLLWTAGSKMEFVYDGTGWIAQNVPYALYGTCSTGASTAAKAVTCNEAVICKGTTISVNMTNTNTAANATMNVGSTLAKDIYANGAKLTTNSRFNWRANTTQKFVFDGQVWRMDDDSVKALATAYITEIDDDGIMVHPEDDSTSGWAISDAIQLFKNGISYIKLWIENNIPKIRIGKEDQGHIILDNDSVDIRNDNKVLASFGATSVIGDTNDWHQTIAANQITFAKGNDTITYISPDKLYTINAEVADAFYISNYSIRNASDGKLVIGLRR